MISALVLAIKYRIDTLSPVHTPLPVHTSTPLKS